MINRIDKRVWLALPSLVAFAAVYASGLDMGSYALEQAVVAAAIVAVVTVLLVWFRRRFGRRLPVSARAAAIAFTLSLVYVYINLGVLWPDTPGPDRWIVTVAAIYTLLLLSLYVAAYWGMGLLRRMKVAVLG